MQTTKPSVAEALCRAHSSLLEDLGQLEAAVQPQSTEGLPKLHARLAATRAHIAEHFRFEEENGYMDVVRKREPRLERSIQQLADEHGQLLRSLDALIARAGSSENLEGSFRQAISEWIEGIRNHEHRENELVQDAFTWETFAED